MDVTIPLGEQLNEKTSIPLCNYLSHATRCAGVGVAHYRKMYLCCFQIFIQISLIDYPIVLL